jgi:hypothetical protein
MVLGQTWQKVCEIPISTGTKARHGGKHLSSWLWVGRDKIGTLQSRQALEKNETLSQKNNQREKVWR